MPVTNSLPTMNFYEDWIPFLLPNVEVLLKSDGSVIIHSEKGFLKIEGLTHRDYGWLIVHVNGENSISEMTPSPERVRITTLCHQLHGMLIGFKNKNGVIIPPDNVAGSPIPTEQDSTPKVRGNAGETDFSHIGILGGGTAGYLTALAFRKKYPALGITLIESSDIPVIGVGEATTPLIVDFLHNYLQLDIVDFYQKVQPTWKLGIKFLWGQPAPYSFINPFGTDDLLMTEFQDGNLNHSTLESILISYDKGMIVQEPISGELTSIMNKVGYAYHLDNKLLLSYLKQKILEAGVIILDNKIKGYDLDPESSGISALITEQGAKLKFELYIDCSGFRSFLLGGALKSEFISFQSSLYTDTAVTGIIENDQNTIPPYTLAETMNHGWNWQIPLRKQHHRGYVFSSAFCNEDQAWTEMQLLNPGIKDPGLVRFASGRREEFWLKNVVGIGNSYGFVEPLESTGIHMIIEEIRTLIDNFPQRKSDKAIQKFINEKIGLQWDYLRWYLALHYKYNQRLNTPFWLECRQNTNISGAADLVDLYREEGPLYLKTSVTPQLFRSFFHDTVFGPFGFDYILMGQKIPFRAKYEAKDDRKQWMHKRQYRRDLADRAMDQRSALSLIDRHTHLLKL
jgi:tryptophan 7-halogenase